VTPLFDGGILRKTLIRVVKPMIRVFVKLESSVAVSIQAIAAAIISQAADFIGKALVESAGLGPSAADLKFLQQLPQTRFRKAV
jgi:hypothetical protein